MSRSVRERLRAAIVIALLAVIVAVVVHLGESQRTDFEVARTLHQDLTAGEVARARQLLGTLRYGSDSAVRQLDPAETLTSYFTLLWCFERIHYGRRSLLQGKLINRRSRAVRFLDSALQWHLMEWSTGLDIARQRLGELTGLRIDDADSRAAFTALLSERPR